MLSLITQLLRRLRYYWRPDPIERSLEEEMTLHLEMKIEAKIAAGIAPGDAAR